MAISKSSAAMGALLGAAASAAALLPIAARPVPKIDEAFVLPTSNILTRGEAALAWDAVYLVEGLRAEFETAEPLDTDFAAYEKARKALGGY